MPRIRSDGGVIGSINTPSTVAASGMWSLKDEERSSRLSTWPAETPIAATDPYFNLNMLLLHGENTNGTNNSVFVDSSTNAYTITRSGTGPQGTFSPFSQTGWSNYFNGTTSYLTAPNNTQFQIDAAFTAECWIYPYDVLASSNYAFIGYHAIATGVGSGGWSLNLSGSTNGQLVFNTYNNNSSASTTTTFNSGASLLTANAWNHIAVSYDGSTYRLFINGSVVGSTASIGAISYTGATFNIGRLNYATPKYFNGYISNVRFVKGSAVYTSAFTPSTTALTAITNTQLLTCQSNRFVDNSTNALAITPSGSTSVQAFSPFAPTTSYSASVVGGSAYFSGSGDYLTLPNNMTVLGSSAYTLEGWFYPTVVSSAEIPLFKLYNATQTVELRIVSSKIQGRINDSATVVGGNTTLYPNQWYHFALVKPTSGTSTAVLYLNGVAEATTASDTTTYTAFTAPRIGANQSPTLYFTGWASSARILNGTGQYTSNFTPPTAPFTNISNTLALVNFTNAGIIDSTSKVDLATFGTAAVSSSQSKYGSTSISIPAATNSYCTINALELNDLRSGSWTVECWVYALGIATRTGFISKSNSTGTSVPFLLEINASGFLQGIAQDSGGQKVVTDASSFTATTWTHVALVRNVNTLTLYKNGVSVGTPQTLSGALVTTTDEVRIGVNKFQSTSAGCYIDDVRISRYARYTTNFTPSTTTFPDQ